MSISRAAAGTLLSRVSGLARDILFAYVFGASGKYDAYVVAISIPFLLRNIFAEGGLSSAFVPLYKKSVEKRAWATSVFLFIVVCVGILSTVIALFPVKTVEIFAGGLNPASFHTAVRGVRVTAFFLLFISLWAWGASILNCHEIFFVPSLSPMFNNLFIIGSLLLVLFFHKGISTVFWGFTLGGLSQFLFEIPYLKKTGFTFKHPVGNEKMRKFLTTFAFTSIAVSLGQLNLFVDTNVASRLTSGSISVIQYANRVYQLPLGILVISLATVYLPEMSSHLDVSKLRLSLIEAFSRLFYMVVPSTFFFMIFSHSIIVLLYRHGTFSSVAAEVTASVLEILMIGFPFRASVIVMNRALYAFENAKFATFVTLAGVAVNTVGDLTLGFVYSVRGLVASTALSSIVSAIFLYVIERKKYGLSLWTIKFEFFKILLSSVLASILSFPISTSKSSLFSSVGGFMVFTLSFMLFSLLFKSENTLNIMSVLTRKRKKQ